MSKEAEAAYTTKDLRMVILVLQGLFAVVALGLYLAAAKPVLDAYHLASRGLTAPGLVTELARISGHNSNSKVPYTTSWAPMVRFTTEAGATFQFRGAINNVFASYRPGDAVEVIYLSNEPHHARINQVWHMWGWPMLLVLAATSSAFCAAASYRGARSGKWLPAAE